MNKGITAFILVVLVCAMGLILYSYINDNDPPVKRTVLADSSPDIPALDDSTVNMRDSVLAGPGTSQNNTRTAPTVVTPSNPGDKPRVLPPVNNDAQPRTTTQQPGGNEASPGRDAGQATAPGQTQTAPADTPQKTEQPAVTPPKPEPQKADPPKPEPPKTAKDGHTLKNISLHFAGQGMKLRIEADSTFQIKTFLLHDPERMVVDLIGKWDDVRAPNIPSNNLISGVRIGKQDAGPRVVLDLKKKAAKHDVNKISDQVVEIIIQ